MKKLKKGVKWAVRVLVPKAFNLFVIAALVFQPVGTPGFLGVLASQERAIAADEEPAVEEEEEDKSEPVKEEPKEESAPAPAEKEEPAALAEEPATSDEPAAPTDETTTSSEESSEAAETPASEPVETPVTEAADEVPAEVPASENVAEESQENDEESSDSKQCLADGTDIKASSDDDWTVNEEKGTAETKENVKLGVAYAFPLDKDVRVTFTCLPKDESKRAPLSIERIKASDIDLPEGVAAASEYAYDITTKMENGDFKYDIELPKSEDVSDASVSYIEKSADEVKGTELSKDDLKKVDEKDVDNKSDTVEVADLDHFTIYLTTYADADLTLESSKYPRGAYVYMQAENLPKTYGWPQKNYYYKIFVKKPNTSTASSFSCRVPDSDGTLEETYQLPANATLGEWKASIYQYTKSDCSDNGKKVKEESFEVIDIQANPSLGQACGLDIALVIDNSDSINSTELGQMKSALNSFVSALSGTPTQFSVTKFGSSASVVQNFPGATATTVINSIGTGGGATNWKDAFIKARSTFDPRASKPNLVIFATDGNPTYPYGAGNVTDPGDLNDAITEANTTKSSNGGVRVLALGIGNELSVDNLKVISGGNVNTGNVLTSDVITTNFDNLAAQLATFAEQTCGGTITVNKFIDNLNTPAGTGWMFDIAGQSESTNANGQTEAVEVNPGTYSVTETGIVSGYSLSSAVCKINGQTVGSPVQNGVGGIEVGNSDIVTCNFINSYTPVCGDGSVNQTSEQCDAGQANGDVCTPAYGGSCTYCTDQCTLVKLDGSYCGDGIKNGQEECDGAAGVPSGEFACTKSCTLDLVEPKVTICHKTNSHNNPYVPEQPNKSADLSGHNGHNGPIWYSGIVGDWGDIIPPFDYIGGSYPGKNWTTEGQAIWRNDCEFAGGLKVIKTVDDESDLTQWSFALDNGKPISANEDGEVDFGTRPAGAYMITEIGPTGSYTLNEVTGENCDQTSNVSATATVNQGQTTVCTFSNLVNKGTITVIKNAVPDSAQDFSFGGALGSFSLDDDSDNTLSNTKVSDPLFPGSYVITENATTGWTLSSISCLSGNGKTGQQDGNSVYLTLNPGENIVCTFTNVFDGTNLAIDKSDTPDPVISGGVLTYVITVNNTSQVAAENVIVTDTLPSAMNSIVSVVSSQGTCSDATLPSPIQCELGTIAAGGSATITLKATVVGLGMIENTASVTTSTYEANTEDNTTKEGTEIVGKPSSCDINGTRFATGVLAASQGVRKDGSAVPSERSIPASVLGAPNTTTGPDSGFYSLGKGGSVTVAFATPLVNGLGTDLSIHEITNGRSSYPEEKATVEVYDGSWHTVGTASSLAASGVTYLDIAPYTNVTQVRITDTTNFAQNGASNADGFDVDAIDADCRSTITVHKNLDTDGDGKVNEQNVNTWTWDIDGSGNHQTGSSQEVVAGSYVISEDNQPTYHFGSLVCDDVPQNSPTPEIEVGEEDAVDCTYTNVRNKGTITIVKDAVNNDSEDFRFFTSFDANPNQGGNQSWFDLDDDNSPTLPNSRTFSLIPGTYTVQEGSENDWKLTDIVCNDENGTIDLVNRKATIALDADEEITCTFTNKELGKIIGFKFNDTDGDGDRDHGEGGLGNWRIFIDQNGNQTYDNGEPTTLTSSFFLTRGAYVLDDLVPGTYSVCEVMQGGWYNSTPICQEVTLTPGDTDFADFGNHRTMKIKAWKIVCDDEKDLPNWGKNGGPNITTSTAQNWVNSHKSCRLEEDWKFQWSYDGVGNPGDNNTADPIANWTTFSPTNGSGMTETEISDLQGGNRLWVREAFQDGYLPFAYGVSGNQNNVSAEMYCHTDVINYDNWEWIDDPKFDETYNCVAWNVPLGSVHGEKWHDRNGDGKRDRGEENLAGWTIFLDTDGDGVLDEGEQSMATSDDIKEHHYGWYWFEDLLPGEYRICEVPQAGWAQTYPAGGNCHTVTLPNDEVMTNNGILAPQYDFGNFKTGKITGYKWNDCDGDGERDDADEKIKRTAIIDDSEDNNEGDEEEVCQETGISGVTVYLDLNHNGSYDDGEPSTETNEDGYYEFTGLLAGDYSVEEVVPEGYTQTSNVCSEEPKENPENDDSLVARVADYDYDNGNGGVRVISGSEFECPIGNTRIPSLSIEKWNDASGAQQPGATVRYHIRVTAHHNDVLDVNVTDVPPEGFAYVGGSAVADQGSLSYVYASPGVWSLGDMVAGQSVELAYDTTISSAQDPGDYKDLAYAMGSSEFGEDDVVADDLMESDNFVGTRVAVVLPDDPETVEVPEDNENKIKEKTVKKTVLGASTLPLTGANTNILAIALLLLIGGIGLYLFGKRREKEAADQSALKTLLFVFSVGTALLFGQPAGAASLAVQIEEPEAVVDSPSFKIGFVALDILGRGVNVRCFREGDGIPFEVITLPVGGGSGDCQISSTIMPADGDYKFYVEAVTTSGASESAESVHHMVKLVTTLPGVPHDYDRHDASCMNTITFVTAADGGKTVKVELFRSLSTTFTADASTKVAELAIGSDTAGSFVEPAPGCSNDYFYALRAVDVYGFVSAFVGDKDRNVDTHTVTNTKTTTVSGTTATTGAIPVSGGSVAGAEGTSQGEGEGAETTESETGTEGSVLGEATSADEAEEGFASRHPWLSLLAVLAVLAIVYYVYHKRRNGGYQEGQ